MGLKIKRQIVTIPAYYRETNSRKYITVHETGNRGKGANAQAHANLQSRGNSRTASWHWQVDDKIAIQSFEHYRSCWHAGTRSGNVSSIGIEICVNSDGNWKKTIDNAARLVARIMVQENIPISRVVQHNNWSGKNCPTNLRAKTPSPSWAEFLNLVRKYAQPNSAHTTGIWDEELTKGLQRALKLDVTGTVIAQPRKMKERNPGLGTGWVWQLKRKPKGSVLIRRLRKWNGGKSKNRRITKGFIKALQRKLKRTRDSQGNPYYSGKIDGVLDRPSATIRALQRALNDGKVK